MDKDSLSSFLWKEKPGESTRLVPKKKLSAPPSPPSPKTFVVQPAAALPLEEKTSVPSESAPLRLRQETDGAPAVVKPKIVYTTPTKTGSAESPKERKSFLPSLVNHNLWTKPSLEAMAGMTEQELARVEHFQIGQYGIGSVTWPGLTDVRFLNIDDLIIFRKGAVTLFPDEDLKPPVGTGLNKTAIIELFVRPKNLELAKKYESRYVDEMRKLTEKNGAEFLSYDLDAWRFRVEHFSTWGIDESMWVKIDSSAPGDENVRATNDLSLFSRIEKDLFTPDIDEEEDVYEESGEGDESMDQQNKQAVFAKEDFVGALAVAPPTREELKALGWDLKVLDLFLNQSFRASYGPGGQLVFPEHPVVCDSHNVEFVVGKSIEKFNQGYLEKLTTLLKSEKTSSWSDLLKLMGESNDSLVSLITALMPSGDQSPSSDSGAAATLAFNDWLSRMNADIIRADPALSFSPAAALSSHHYSPSASELLVNSGHPRLALAAAAAADEKSRRLMQDQMSKIRDADPNTHQVAQILGGRLDNLGSEFDDWEIELALRYWYCEGDMSGFEPPAKALEWRVMNSIVLGESDQLTKLLDSPDLSGNELFAMLVSIMLIQRKLPLLFSQDQVCKVITACSDYVLTHPSVDWQLSPIVLSFLPSSGHRDQLIQDVVLRHADKDCEVLRELAIVSEHTLAAVGELIERAPPQ
jgi:nuclear pore complex protein Nup98-Nup96